MPNHVHALFQLRTGQRLGKTAKSWKGVSAHNINICLSRSGTLWMEELFDRLVRDENHFWNCARYIRNNPAKAKLRAGEFRLYESKEVAQHLDAAVRIAEDGTLAVRSTYPPLARLTTNPAFAPDDKSVVIPRPPGGRHSCRPVTYPPSCVPTTNPAFCA